MAKFFASNSMGSVPRSISTILTGTILLFVPGLTMKAVMIVIGGMLMLGGLVTLVLSNLRKGGLSKGIWSAQGIMNILFGIVFIAAPSAMIKLFMIFIGIILLIMGLIQLAGALGSLTRSIWAWVFLIIGLFTTGSGIFLLTDPFKSAETILPFLGGLFILNGFSELIRIWKAGKRPPKYNGSEVHDIPYEEV
ncbi:MAG: DUF308 domain-containing protein [Mariniphaga sp.]